MKPTTEKRDLALPSSVERSVPGIHEAIAQLRLGFPFLSDESIANILGLPERDADILMQAVIKNAEVKE
jgi:hypothetical protein